MAYTNIADAYPALGYGNEGWLEITAICKEGNITVTTSGVYTHRGEMLESTATIATAVSKENLVSLSTDSANTATATDGVPVVEVITAAGMAVGILASTPRWVQTPSSTQTTWADMLSGDYYRIAKLWIPMCRLFDADVPAANGTNIAPGNSLIYDVSSDGWVYARAGLDDADGAVWDSSGADTGANGFIAEPIALTYLAASTAGNVLAAHGLIPLPLQT